MNPCLSKFRFWFAFIQETLFPRGCALCGKSLYADAFYGLCRNCREKLSIPYAERGRCSICGQPLISELETCLPCRNGPERSFDRLVSLYPYMGMYKKALGEYKFKRSLNIGNFFAEKITQGLDLLLKNEDVSDFCLAPVPPRPGKIKHSGWDQIEYLAKLLERGHSVSLKRCLKRLPSVSQKKLNREKRLLNLKGKIIINKKIFGNTPLIPKTVILFDDVYTTGATMDACASALKSAGTERVFGICLCYD